VPSVPTLPNDDGRLSGAKQVLADEFNCLSRYSDAKPEQCGERQFTAAEGEEVVRAYRPPTLRDAAERAP
jgi:cytochrome c peroxidase